MGTVTRLFVAVSMISSGSLSSAQPTGNVIKATVPIVCRAAPTGEASQEGSSYSLGRLVEYCNAPKGFQVDAVYPPGELRSAKLQIGDREIVLSGTGEDEVMRDNKPSISTFKITVTPKAGVISSSMIGFRAIQL